MNVSFDCQDLRVKIGKIGSRMESLITPLEIGCSHKSSEHKSKSSYSRESSMNSFAG